MRRYVSTPKAKGLRKRNLLFRTIKNSSTFNTCSTETAQCFFDGMGELHGGRKELNRIMEWVEKVPVSKNARVDARDSSLVDRSYAENDLPNRP